MAAQSSSASLSAQASLSIGRRGLFLIANLWTAFCLAYATWLFAPRPAFILASLGWVMMLGAIVGLGMARMAQPQLSHSSAASLPALPPSPLRPIRWRGVVLSVALIAWCIGINVQENYFYQSLSVHGQMALMLAGWGIGLWSLAGAPRFNPAWLDHLRPSPHGLLLGLVVLCALFLRVWDLTGAIPRWVDEAHLGEAVYKLRVLPQALLMPYSQMTPFSWFYPYLQLWTTHFFAPDLDSLRLVSALFGTFQVAALYPLMRGLFDKHSALIACALLASFPPHLHWSRLGLNNIVEPSFMLISLSALVWGLRRGGRTPFVMAGAALGMTHYFYEVGRLFYTPLMLAFLLGMALFAPQQGVIARLWHSFKVRYRPRSAQSRPALRQGLARPLRAAEWRALCLSFALVALPLYYVWMVNNLSLVPRLQGAGRNLLSEALEPSNDQAQHSLQLQLQYASLAYVQIPDGTKFYAGDTALILIPLVPCFLFGLAWCVVHVRRAGAGLLLLWVGGIALANGLFSMGIHSPRYVAVLPALCAVIALGLVQLWQWWLGGRWRVGLALVVLLAVLGQAAYYGFYHLPHFYRWAFGTELDPVRLEASNDYDDLHFRAVRLLPPNTQVTVISRAFYGRAGWEMIPLFFQRDDLRFQYLYRDEFSAEALRILVRTRPHAFFLDQDDSTSLALIQRYFDLEPAEYSPYRLPRERQAVLYLALPTLANLNHPSQWQSSPSPATDHP